MLIMVKPESALPTLDSIKIVNAALPNPPDEDIQHMFLNFVDMLTAWHLRILKFFENPKEWGQKQGIRYTNQSIGIPARALEEAFSELRRKREFYDQVVRDLFSQGLIRINSESLDALMSKSETFASCKTPMANN